MQYFIQEIRVTPTSLMEVEVEKNRRILKKESKDLSDKLVVKYERKTEVWDESMVFALNWVISDAIY